MSKKAFRFRWTPSARWALEKGWCHVSRKHLMTLFPGASWRAIQQQASRMNLKRPRTSKEYTPSEMEIIRRHYGLEPVKNWIHLLPNRSVANVVHKARRMQLATREKTYDPFEQAIFHILSLYPKECAIITGRDRNSISTWRGKRGLFPKYERFSKCRERKVLEAVGALVAELLGKGHSQSEVVTRATQLLTKLDHEVDLTCPKPLAPEEPFMALSKPTPTYRNGLKRYSERRLPSAEKTSLP